MKIKKQKNVYFIDLGKNLYKGYIETLITLEKEDKIYYKSSLLDIISVKLYLQGENKSYPEFKILKGNSKDKQQMTDTIEIDVSSIESPEITIKIEYKPNTQNTSIIFYKPVFPDDKHKEVIGLNRNCFSFELFPSIVSDNSRIGYPWDLTYILPNTEEFKIVSPGILNSFKEEERTNISLYYVEESLPGFINFAIGSFERVEMLNSDDKKVVFLPINVDEYNESLNEFIEDCDNIIKYTEHFLNRSFPLPLNVLFSLIETELTLGIGTTICNISNLSPVRDIEQSISIKRTISHIISSQIFYFYVCYTEITDCWIFTGMKGYLEDYCSRFLLGHNDFLHTLKEETDFIFENDVLELPLCDSRRDLLSYQSEFFLKKCKLIFHTLENNLSKAFLEKICNFTLKKSNLEIGSNFTYDFIVLIKDITGKDMRNFFDTYVFSPGLVKLNFKFTIDKKKNRVDFKVEQTPTSKVSNCNTKVSGFVSVKSYEVEGCYDHSFNFNQDNYFYYHTRTKKKKKPEEEEEEIMPLLWIRIDPKREHMIKGVVEQPDYMFIEQLLDKNVIGQIEAIDYLSKRPSIQICEAFERILENSQMYYKIRVRVLYALSKVNLENYVGFQRVIQFFIKKFCVQSSTVIKPNDFNYTNYFLQKHSIKALSFSDPFIVKDYNGRFVGSASIICAFLINILRFNDNSMNIYSDSLYISSVIESLIRPILAMKEAKRAEIVNFTSKKECKNLFGNEEPLVEEIRIENSSSDENTNENHPIFSPEGGYETSSVSNSQPESMTDPSDYIQIAIREIERYRLLDMVFPSHNNTITESSLYFLGRLAINSSVGLKKEVLLALSHYPNTFTIRKTALILLLLLYPDKNTFDFIYFLLSTDIYKIKLLIIETIEEIISTNIVDIKENLIDFRDRTINLCYDLILKDKIENIVMYLEGKDISEEEYANNLIEFYNLKYEKEFYFQKMMIKSGLKSTESIKIRLINFIEMKKENLKNTYILKIPIKGTISINSEGPSRKRVEKKKLKVVEEVKIEQEVVETLAVPIEEGKQSIIKNEEIEIDTNLEENNIKEMLKEDLITKELISSCSESLTVESPFIPSKNNLNYSQSPKNVKKIENYLTITNEDICKKVEDKKIQLEGLFKEMRRIIEQNVSRINLWRVQQRVLKEREIVKEQPVYDLEKLLLEDEEESPLETFLENDWEEQFKENTNLIDIDDFLENDLPSPNQDFSFKLRLRISWTFRIKAVDMRTIRRPSPVEKKTIVNNLLPIDLSRLSKPQRIFYETVRDVNLKPFNSLIAKNREKKFFSWIPKTFQEIEEMVVEEIGYSSISKELERSLVFVLTYSLSNTRPYLIGKKMFDTFESMRYYYTPIPPEVTEMTPVLRDACVDFLNKVYLDESFSSFINPVNLDSHKTYVDIVRFPMCLEIVKQKMSVYRSKESFYGDLRQILKNCCYFNQNNSEICNNARKLLRFVNEFNRRICTLKIVFNSLEIIKRLIVRFSCSSLYEEIKYKIDSRTYKTFFELLSDIDRIKSNYTRGSVTPHQLVGEVEKFKAEIYYWFNLIEGKSICFGL